MSILQLCEELGAVVESVSPAISLEMTNNQLPEAQQHSAYKVNSSLNFLTRNTITPQSKSSFWQKIYSRFKASSETKAGFSLVEVIVVVTMIIILASITMLIFKPQYLFTKTRNMQRTTDTSAILSAVYRYMSDNDSNFPQLSQTSQKNCC